MTKSQVWLLAALMVTTAPIAYAGPVVTSVGGDNTTGSIAGAITAFQNSLGAPNAANAPPQPSGRRDITWDGAGGTFGTPFNNFSSRGAVFTTPGTGFEISGAAAPLLEFGDINPTYPDIFRSFSSPRLFTPLGNNVLDVLFTVPGTTNVPAATAGFGAVFTDVDFANTTSMEFFGFNGVSLGTFFVPPGTVASESLSFLGVSFTEGSVVGRVRIKAGNAAVGPNDGAGTDIVVMDDFTFREPQLIPEPGIPFLMAAALVAFALVRKNKKQLEGERP
jgi:hypothetical protein